MMNKNTFLPRTGFPVTAQHHSGRDDFIDLQKIWLMARRQMKLVALAGFVGIVVGILFLRASPASYVSSAQVLVDLNLDRVVGTISSTTTPAIVQSDAQILSSIEVLKSKRLALVVVDQLNLTEDPVFLDPPDSAMAKVLTPVRWILSLLRGAPQPVEENTSSAGNAAAPPEGTEPRLEPVGRSIQERRRDIVANMLRQDLLASRMGRSFVIGIGYVSHDPDLSRRIVDAYTQAFMNDQQIATVNASQQATSWMKVRIDELAKQAQEASLAAERFRSENSLSSARGELVSEQRLAELNGQLVLAESELAQAQARSEQMAAVIAGGRDAAVENAVVASSDVQSPRMAELRNQLIEQRRRRTDIVARWGESHPQAVSLQRETEHTADLLFAELQQVAAQSASEYAVARNRQEALRAQISEQTGENALSSPLLVQLRDLEQRAETLNALYATTLANYEQALQQQSFPVSNLRVISQATMPESASGPRFIPIVGAFTILALLGGSGIGLLREIADKSFRTGGAVANMLGVKFLGYLPALKHGGKRGHGDLLRVATQSPRSSFSEVLRNVRLHLDGLPVTGPGKVLGVISVLPSEGKSTVAANLAGLLAKTDARVLLIDADFRRPQISIHLAPDARLGILDALQGRTWQETVLRDPSSGFAIMPNPLVLDGRPQGAEALGSDAMARLLATLRESFDYILLDLPPVGPVVDASAVQPLTDAFLLVLRWGSTPTELTRSVIGSEPELAHKLIGAVLNQTDLDALARYGGSGTEARAYRRYKTYYNEPA